jgi:alkylation response protein AidB-like acyl-CoA dehydrogenase
MLTDRTSPPSLDDARVQFDLIFADLRRRAGQRDQDRVYPFGEVRALATAGFTKLRVPRELGGFDVDLPTLFELLAQAASADANIAQILRGHFTMTEILRQRADKPEHEYWLRKIADGAIFGNAQAEEGNAGPGSPFSTVVRNVEGGPDVVHGTKVYTTGALYADYVRVAVADQEGTPIFAVVSATDRRVEHLDDWDGVGQRLTASGKTHFEDVPVEPSGLLSRDREDVRPLPTFLQLVHVANLVGIARNIVDDAVDLVRSRRRTNVLAQSGVAAEDPDVLAVVGHIKRHCLTVDSLLGTVANSLQSANDRWAAGEHDEDLYNESFVTAVGARVTMTETVLAAASLLFEAGSASSVRQRTHFDRHWRNARTLGSVDPIIYLPRVVGDYVVNGTAPKSFYKSGPKKS